MTRDNRAREAAAEQRTIHEGEVSSRGSSAARLRISLSLACLFSPALLLLLLQLQALQARLQSLQDQHAAEVADVHRRLAAHAEHVDADHASAARAWKARDEALSRRLSEAEEAAQDARAELDRVRERSAAALKAAEAAAEARAGEAVAAAVQQAEAAMRDMQVRRC